MMATIESMLIVLTTVIFFINQALKSASSFLQVGVFFLLEVRDGPSVAGGTLDFLAAYFCFSIFFRSASSSFSFRFCSFASSFSTFFLSPSCNSCRYSSSVMTQDLMITLVFFFFLTLSFSGHTRMSLR